MNKNSNIVLSLILSLTAIVAVGAEVRTEDADAFVRFKKEARKELAISRVEARRAFAHGQAVAAASSQMIAAKSKLAGLSEPVELDFGKSLEAAVGLDLLAEIGRTTGKRMDAASVFTGKKYDIISDGAKTNPEDEDEGQYVAEKP
ncbi:MAG: hypothetical protein HY360_14675 [Verrucomicrobia bacterium]|nr:hypothetical protein [Verrucomicrobiota bacterium]